MKFVLSALLFVSPTFAAELPNCWKESGQKIVDGKFVITIKLKEAASEDIEKIKNLIPPSRFRVKSTDYSKLDITVIVFSPAYTGTSGKREEVKNYINESFAPFIGAPGIRFDCAYKNWPIWK